MSYKLTDVSITKHLEGSTEYKVGGLKSVRTGNVGRIGTSGLGPRGFVVDIDFHGATNFDFEFLGNVSAMRLRQDNKLLYSGPPVPTFTSDRGTPLTVELSITKDLEFKISANCGFGRPSPPDAKIQTPAVVHSAGERVPFLFPYQSK